jgi:hypothetical protein
VGYLTGWACQGAVQVDNFTSNLVDYQIEIVFDSAALFAKGQCLANCNDVRVTTIDGTTLLPHWIKTGTQNTATTRVWTKITLAPGASTTLYLYCGKPDAPNVESYDNVLTKLSQIADCKLRLNMDEGAGVVTLDDSGEGMTFTFVGTPEWQVTDGGQWDGVSKSFATGSHLHFTAAETDYLDCPWNANLDMDSMTFCCWIKHPYSVATYYTIATRANMAGWAGWTVRYNAPNLWAQVFDDIGNGNVVAGGAFAMDNTWHFLQLKVQAGGNAQFYVDAVAVGSPTPFPRVMNRTWGGVPLAMRIAAGSAFWGGYPLNGSLDAIHIFNRVTLPAEDQCLFNRRVYTAHPPTVTMGTIYGLLGGVVLPAPLILPYNNRVIETPRCYRD